MSAIESNQPCPWCLGSEAYIAYHDREWGTPVHDERMLFELLILEGAQAGLSWSTILNKRDNYREAFDNFDARKIARYTDSKVARLLADAGIVRNRLKIAAAVQNAKAFLAVQKEFGSFDCYIWAFVGGEPRQHRRRSLKQVPARTARIRCDEQGPVEARLQVRRLDHLLRLHAGHRHGQRPPGRVLSPHASAGPAMSLRLLLLLAALLGPVSTASAQAKDSDSANAVFLVASPGLLDPNFRETVVLVTRAEDGSNVGFIINRPGPRSLAQILPKSEVLKRFTEPLYLGGPVEAAGLFAIFRAKDNPEGALRVLGDVSFALDPAVVEQLLHAPPGRVRFSTATAAGRRDSSRSNWSAAAGTWSMPMPIPCSARTRARCGTRCWCARAPSARPCASLPTRVPWAAAALSPPARAERDQLSGVSSDTPRRARRVSHRFGR